MSQDGKGLPIRAKEEGSKENSSTEAEEKDPTKVVHSIRMCATQEDMNSMKLVIPLHLIS